MLKKGVKLILRPPRSRYELDKVPIESEIPGFGKVVRDPVIISNDRDEEIQGSFYRAPNPAKSACVIYLHGNASNQLEGRFVISLFVPYGISVFCFDFAGCGESSGKYVSLGFFESRDMENIIHTLRERYQIDEFLLWGRSMGAAVALMVGYKYDEIKGIVADSSYSSITSLIRQLGKTKRVPKWFVKKVIKKLRKKIIKKANFDINKVSPFRAAKKLNKPLFLIHGKKDKFVIKDNSELIYDRCPSEEKRLNIVPGKHNTDRPMEVIMSAAEFLFNSIGISIHYQRAASTQQPSQNADQHFGNVDEMLKNI